MFAVFDDLEQQAEGLALVEREAEVHELSAAEYAHVSLSARMHASVGREVTVRLSGGQALRGRLARVGEDWLMVVAEHHEWIVRDQAIQTVSGLSTRAHSEETWSVVDRLSLRALLRRLSAESGSCVVHFLDDRLVEGRLGRVGRDFVELYVGDGPMRKAHMVPFVGVAALQGRAV